MVKIFTGIAKSEVRRSFKDRRLRVLWVVASYLGEDGHEYRKSFEFKPGTNMAAALAEIRKGA